MRPPSTGMAASDLKHLNFGVGHREFGVHSFEPRGGQMTQGHSNGVNHHGGHSHSVNQVSGGHHFNNHHQIQSSFTAQVNSSESVFHYKCV